MRNTISGSINSYRMAISTRIGMLPSLNFRQMPIVDTLRPINSKSTIVSSACIFPVVAASRVWIVATRIESQSSRIVTRSTCRRTFSADQGTRSIVKTCKGNTFFYDHLVSVCFLSTPSRSTLPIISYLKPTQIPRHWRWCMRSCGAISAWLAISMILTSYRRKVCVSLGTTPLNM